MCVCVCDQIILKCEKRVKALQAEHSEEMSKRDVLLRRCKDTILRLETELAGKAVHTHLHTHTNTHTHQRANTKVWRSSKLAKMSM